MQEIANTSYKAVGQKYGVSDNAVRKWVKSYIASDPKFQNRTKIDGHFRCDNDNCNNKTSAISLSCLSCMIKNRDEVYFHTQKCAKCNCFAKTNPCERCSNVSDSEELIDTPTTIPKPIKKPRRTAKVRKANATKKQSNITTKR